MSLITYVRRRVRLMYSKIGSYQTPTGAALTNLESSLSPADTLRDLRKHKWSYLDAEYLIIILIAALALSVVQTVGPTVKMISSVLLLGTLVIPMTRQFFLPGLPVIGWLVFFYSCQFISGDHRPPIWVRVLPALENIFYGANISNLLSTYKNTAFNLMAWLPYGITHYGITPFCGLAFFIWGPPGYFPSFARTFGYMNIFGVFIQLLFPCSPPWYENLYGLAPANYSIKGSPAGLAAIDKLFGIDLYTSAFTASPLVFGAFPSLHAATATLLAFFMSLVFPRYRPFFGIYALWMCWATMYLSHHYAVDLVGGALLAGVSFYISYRYFLPRVQQDKANRWDYDYVEYGQPDHTYETLPADNFSISNRGQEGWASGSSSCTSHSRSESSATLGSRSPGGKSGEQWNPDSSSDLESHTSR